jgi:DNA-binding response OmpR family regulator
MLTVLIADDDANLLEAVSDSVDSEGWTVLAAASHPAALQPARSNHVDLVLADVWLADGQGRALEKAFRALGPAGAAPFVFMTASPQRSRELGGSTVLTKPFSVREVVGALEDAIRGHRTARRGPRSSDRPPSGSERDRTPLPPRVSQRRSIYRASTTGR